LVFELFLKGKLVDSVHEPRTMTGTRSTVDHSAAWTRDHRGAVARTPELGLWPLPGSKAHWRGSGAEGGEVGRRSPGLKRWRGSRAMMTKRRQWKILVEATLELGEERRRVEKGAAKIGRGIALL
jgi:hypothetical protein